MSIPVMAYTDAPATFTSHLPAVGTIQSKTVTKRTYEEGTTVFLCNQCGSAHERLTQAQRCVGQHTMEKRGRKPGRKAAPKTASPSEQLRALADLLETPVEDNWKQRALKAERDLSALRKILGS